MNTVQDKLCSLVRATSARLLDFRSAFLNAGYRVSLSHACKNALKTDAPNQFVFDMCRAWEKLHPTNRDKLDKDSVAWKLLNAESVNTEVSICGGTSNYVPQKVLALDRVGEVTFETLQLLCTMSFSSSRFRSSSTLTPTLRRGRGS